jgi:pyridoxal phosphate enzyme (YggS family)
MIAENICHIRERIAAASARAGRRPEDVTLIAVSKTFPAERIGEAVRHGVLDIGENYVQELVAKREALQEYPIRWHFVGHLQSNKVKYIAGWIHMVHSVDNARVVQELNARAARAGRSIDVLVEVNTTAEESKFGLSPEQTRGFVKSLMPYESINIAGLMTIGPFLPDPEGSRPMFRRLRMVKEELAGMGQSNMNMRHLSMGMTGDFEVAIEEGATMIRIGTAIFGSRKRAGTTTQGG